MKIKYLNLEKLNKETVQEIKEDTFFVIKPVKKDIKRTIKLDIAKKGTSVNIVFASVIKAGKLNLDIEIIHEKPETHSNIQIRTILEEGAHFKFKGNIKITDKSNNSKGVLNIKGLSIGENITWEVKPNLEIQNNQISANHKASLINFSKKQLTYLTSRGLSQEEALTNLKKGFILEVLEEIPENKAKRTIIGALNP